MFTFDIRALDVAVVVAVLFILYRARAAYQARKNGPLPPGPKGWPILGCIDMPVDYYWLKYAELGQIYGMSLLQIDRSLHMFNSVHRWHLVIFDSWPSLHRHQRPQVHYGDV